MLAAFGTLLSGCASFSAATSPDAVRLVDSADDQAAGDTETSASEFTPSIAEYLASFDPARKDGPQESETLDTVLTRREDTGPSEAELSHTFVLENDIARVDFSSDDVGSKPIESIAPGVSSPDPEYEQTPVDPPTNVPSISTADQAVEMLSLDEVVARAQLNHPQANAAQRRIDVARASIMTAGRPENPRFVLDLDTPASNNNDPTELMARMTIPIGTKRERHARERVAMASVSRAEIDYLETLQEIAEVAREAGLREAYFRERLRLEREREAQARRRVDLIAPDQTEGDPASNLVRYIEAQLASDEATSRRLSTQREWAVAKAELAESMGTPQDERVGATAQFDRMPLELPPLETVRIAAETESLRVAEASAALNESRRSHDLERSIKHEKRVGPRFQDRLGENDDSVGVRLRTVIPIHNLQRGPIRESAAEVQRRLAQVEVARLWVQGRVTRLYRELEVLATEIQHYRNNEIVQQQESMRRENGDLLTAEQLLRIDEAVTQNRLARLDVEYRFALLLSRIQFNESDRCSP